MRAVPQSRREHPARRVELGPLAPQKNEPHKRDALIDQNEEGVYDGKGIVARGAAVDVAVGAKERNPAVLERLAVESLELFPIPTKSAQP